MLHEILCALLLLKCTQEFAAGSARDAAEVRHVHAANTPAAPPSPLHSNHQSISFGLHARLTFLCRLDKKDIGAMRKSAQVTGSDIVEKLVEGSATFETKTGFSKAKYIRKKMQKHVFTVRVLQPTAFNMAQVYYSKHLPRVHRLRFDSLARLLTSSNVSSNARVLCVDGCGGLVAGAILEKLAPISSTLPHADNPAADAAQVDHSCLAANKSPRGGLVIAYPDQRAAIDAGVARRSFRFGCCCFCAAFFCVEM
jgi:hypothetical protein